MKEIYIDSNGRKIKVVKRTGDDVTVIIDGKVSHVHIDYMMMTCKKIEK